MMEYVPYTLKYRPQTFSDLTGQEVVSQTLQNMIRRERVFPGLIFAGTRGSGKTTTARILAKALNCLDRKGAEPCNVCENCVAIQEERSVLVEELDAASHGGIDDVRQIKDIAAYNTLEGAYKVWIIDEAHSLSKAAWEAFLKLLEEPPGPIVFVFCSTNIKKFPETILSRCMTFAFRRQTIPSLVGRLRRIVGQENLEVEESTLVRIAEYADGGMRDAVLLLDQAVSFSGSNHVELATIHRLMGRIPDELYFDLIRAVVKVNLVEAHHVLDEVFSQTADIDPVIESLTRIYRDVFFVINGVDLMDKSDSYVTQIGQLAKDLSPGYVAKALESLFQVKVLAVRGNLTGRQILDFGLIRLLPASTTKQLEPPKPVKPVQSFEDVVKALGAEEVRMK